MKGRIIITAGGEEAQLGEVREGEKVIGVSLDMEMEIASPLEKILLVANLAAGLEFSEMDWMMLLAYHAGYGPFAKKRELNVTVPKVKEDNA